MRADMFSDQMERKIKILFLNVEFEQELSAVMKHNGHEWFMRVPCIH